MTESKYNTTPNHSSSPKYQKSFGENNRLQHSMDLVEVLGVLWRSKLILLAITVFFSLSTIAYTLTIEEWWSSKAKIVRPQVSDYSQLKEQTKLFQPVFDTYKEDGVVLINKDLDEIINSKALFNEFIYNFNSSENKKSFLNQSDTFKNYLKSNKIESESGVRISLNQWSSKIAINQADRNEKDIYSLSFQSISSENSFVMLKNYIAFVSERVAKNVVNNFQATIMAKRNELKQTLFVYETQARNYLEVEKERTKYALDIALAAELSKPIQNFGNNEIFVVNLGSKALSAKIDALNSVKNLSVLDPRIQQVKALLSMIDNTHLNSNLEFKSYRFIDTVERPLNRDEPKRLLIVLLATLFGAFVAVGIVVLRYILTRSR